jgi:lysophospholipase L1-like esterase
MRRVLALGLLAGIVCVALTAPAAPSRNAASPLRYIALGDSFSSGEGVPPFRPGTDRYLPVRDTCHRSFRAYPALVAGRKSSPGAWGFWACSGARIADMIHASNENPREIAQLDHIAPPGRSNPGVDLVTLTIGGNDAQFSSATSGCFFARIVPGLETCQADWRLRVRNEVARLRTTLPPLYRAIRARAPRARILVLGYPNPFPPSMPARSPCRAWLESADLRWLHRAVDALNASVRASAAAAHVTYLAPTGFVGHDACSKSPWFNGLYVLPTMFRYSFHPNVLGQRRLAEIALAAI